MKAFFTQYLKNYNLYELQLRLYQPSPSKRMRKIKQFVEITQYGNNQPLLQSILKPVDIKNAPLNFQKDMQLLQRTATHHQLVSLSANQIRMSHRMFVVLNPSLISPGKWGDYQNVKPQDYQTIVNPELVDQTKIKFKDFQECPSIPGMRFHIWNPILQTYRYYKPVIQQQKVKFQQESLTLKGFNARLWDHQVRHLNGILPYADEVSHCQISVNNEFQDNPGMYELVQVMKREIKFMRKQNLIKYFKSAKKSNESQAISKDIPDQITQQLKSKMGRQYKRVKQILQRQMGNEKDEK